MVDDLFKIGTGWLGWSPTETWNTTLPQIFLALEGFIEQKKATNPFGGGARDKDKKAPKPPGWKAQTLSPEAQRAKVDLLKHRLRRQPSGD